MALAENIIIEEPLALAYWPWSWPGHLWPC